MKFRVQLPGSGGAISKILHYKAVQKNSLVSFPAGGRKCGQSGGRNLFFHIFCLSGKKIFPFSEREKKKKKLSSGHSTGNGFFLVWPKDGG